MSITNSRTAYEACYDVLDQALASASGTRVQLPSSNDAVNYRVRLHYARKLDRDDSKKRHPPDHPDHGKSDYDRLIVTIDDTWVYIRPLTKPLVVEDL